MNSARANPRLLVPVRIIHRMDVVGRVVLTALFAVEDQRHQTDGDLRGDDKSHDDGGCDVAGDAEIGEAGGCGSVESARHVAIDHNRSLRAS
jgi:hypothetical protein